MRSPGGAARAASGSSSGTEKLAVSVEEAAALLGISRAFAYELVARNELPALRLGRRIVIPRQAVEAMVDRASAAFGLAIGDRTARQGPASSDD